MLYNAIKIFYFAEKYDNEKLLYVGFYKHLNIHKNQNNYPNEMNLLFYQRQFKLGQIRRKVFWQDRKPEKRSLTL